MKYLVDTNIYIHFFRGQFNLIDKIREIDLQHCAISEITLAELAYGAENSSNPKKNFKLIARFAVRFQYQIVNSASASIFLLMTSTGGTTVHVFGYRVFQ